LVLTVYLARIYKLSHASFTLIFFYLVMLVMQAHYGVGFVPLGVKLAPYFGTDRNIFDRITHCFSGLLLFYPLYEMTRQGVGRRDFLDYMIPSGIIMGLGAVYEIAEWLAARYSGPRTAFLFIGAQDDFYDTPKDLAMAFFGVIIAAIVVFVIDRIFRIKIRKKRE
jgi:putative membrane protein